MAPVTIREEPVGAVGIDHSLFAPVENEYDRRKRHTVRIR
jgi:hypothetical protein